jgi:hypothetical protein
MKTLRNLKERVKVLLRGINKLPIALSPVKQNSYSLEPFIHRLPVELLQQIFLLVVHDVPDYPSIFTPVNRHSHRDYTISANLAAPPLLFTRVCHFWRDIVHSTPAVWSRILVELPCHNAPLRPPLPSLLRFWLARSGSQPLSLCIQSGEPLFKSKFADGGPPDSQANYQLFDILISEIGRWETVTFASFVCRWKVKLNTLETPQLRTLECYSPDVKTFNAPNLSRLHIRGDCCNTLSGPGLTTPNIRHLHLGYASIHAIRSTAVMFPHMKTLAVDRICSGCESESGPLKHSISFLEIQSMTLPICPRDDFRPKFVSMFDGLDLPMMQRLNLVGELRETQVVHVRKALAAASCHLRVVDFQPKTATSGTRRKVVVGIAKPLLSVAEEVYLRGELVCCRTPGH